MMRPGDDAGGYAEIEERGCEPIIPLRGAKANQPALPLALGGRLFPRIARHTERFKRLYRRRVMVEREFGRLKHELGLAPLRVRGLAKVQLHTDLTILARLSLALARAREATALPLAA
jgi:DDE family transposase